MKLKSTKFTLRALKEEDFKDILENLGDLEVLKELISVPYPYTEKDAKEEVKYYMDEAEKDNKENYGFGIEYKNKVIGMVCLHMVNMIQGHCFLDYWIGKNYWKQGIGFESCSQLISFAFKKLGLKTIESGPFADNIASEKLLEKLGFKKKYLLPKQSKSMATGKMHDVQTYVLLKEDWQKRKRG